MYIWYVWIYQFAAKKKKKKKCKTFFQPHHLEFYLHPAVIVIAWCQFHKQDLEKTNQNVSYKEYVTVGA